MFDAFAIVAFVLALLPFLMYLRNLREFRRPEPAAGEVPHLSVLIPARNEEGGIAACVEAVLVSRAVTLEVIVLDDGSTDRTAEIVREIAARDPRVRLEPAPPLPPGWAGKQHACYALSQLAKYDAFAFLDADVRLSDTALSRMHGFRLTSGAALVSGFPRQETTTILEVLVVPLINWLLLSYLPIHRMRASSQTGLGAGCGQWFLTTREAYQKAGGHEAVKGSFHDGIMLPRAYRAVGLKTDLCDGTADATCRMYRSAGQVWNGFAKNAREGMAGSTQIWIWTMLLFCGHVLPFVLLPFFDRLNDVSWLLPPACVMSMTPRIDAAFRFRQPLLGALLHPVAVLGLLAIQWYAAARAWLGTPVGWKGRPKPMSEVAT